MSPDTVNREIVPTLLQRMAPLHGGRKAATAEELVPAHLAGGGTIGARVVDERRIGELEKIIREQVIVGLPDTRLRQRGRPVRRLRRLGALHRPASLQRRCEGSGKGRRGRTPAVGKNLPGANVQAFPNTDASQAELRAVPDDRRIAESGWNAALGTVVRALGDGAWLGEYFNGETRVPVDPARRRR